MNRPRLTIPKQPVRKPAEDYYRLRREGIGFLEQMGSSLWTDYNLHDPGVTTLEALCYAITDLAYRTGWDIKDLLAPAQPPADPTQPFPHQPFFTARGILTVNPCTPDDFRRLLINLDGVRNAWVFGKACACDVHYYAWCQANALTLSYHKADEAELRAQVKKVEPLGLYDVRLELEIDPELGDLNDRKLEQTYNVFDPEGKPHPVTLELRFPDWGLGAGDQRDLFVNSEDAFTGENGASFQLKVSHLGATKTYDVLADPELKDEEAPNANDYIRKHWRNVFYVSFEITLNPGGEQVVIPHAALRIFGDAFSREQASIARLTSILGEQTSAGFIQRYRQKLLRVDQSVTSAKVCLQAHRNLDEDYCRIAGIEVDDVAVCADVEVLPDADIELVQAKIWFEIEQYFNPPVPFYALKELMDAGMPVEDIFNGPAMDSGFIKAKDLEAAELKSELRTSDIVNRLMDIEGVVAVNNLLLSKYDAEGNVVAGAADPVWTNGTPLFNPKKTSASWLLVVTPLHQPRFYRNLSRFLFYKNGLPFLPRTDEANDTLVQLRGEAERPKLQDAPKDLPIPAGTFRSPEAYSPVQNSFPLTYGIGPDGLSPRVAPLRQAQARQMKAYLMVFEQLLGNAFAQLAHTADLFSLDPNIHRTYFVKEFSESIVQGYSELKVDGFDRAKLEEMAETRSESLERRNRFLDHIMARFGEQFGEYALLLTNLHGEQVALDRLINDKIEFLKAYPVISHDRGKAFNYTQDHCSPENISGLEKRIRRLLGWNGNERVIVVEHLLLRPKFPGDALFPACTDGPCKTCGDEDPYSFRLTFVMPGWLAPFNSNLAMRDFADRTIRQEIPSHLIGKICWVGNDGRQFERFEEAWCKWLEANAAFDWTEERVQDRVEAILRSNIATDSGAKTPEKDELCKCAATIVAQYGMVFYRWMETNITAGASFEELSAFVPEPIALCPGLSFKPDTGALIEELLKGRYKAYKEVSYRLRIVVHLLAGLRNTYPGATLHDCDDGSDENPVRLGKTALGKYSPKQLSSMPAGSAAKSSPDLPGTASVRSNEVP